MAKWKCKTCLGEYFDTQRNGRTYFHACPPIANPAFQPNPAEPRYDPREFVERKDKRDENADDILRPGPKKIRAEGKGREELEPLPWELEQRTERRQVNE